MNKTKDEKISRVHIPEGMQVLRHHLYEYKKGLRNLILHTANSCHEPDIVKLLEKKNVNYLIIPASQKNINVFFGNEKCINIVRKIGNKSLSNYTDEEDFILGIMLGYDRLQQCDRYLKRGKNSNNVEELIG